MLLFIDTETTGMIRWNEPNESISQPRIVQLAALLMEPDGTERAMLNVLVNAPATIDPSAAAVHGISNELLAAAGIPSSTALSTFAELFYRANTIVAHNIAFDRRMLLIECAYNGYEQLRDSLQARASFCTMQAATPLCRTGASTEAAK